MNRLSTITILTAITLFMFSCSTLSVSQKRYSNGLNIALNNKADEMNTLLEKAKRENAKSEKRIAQLNLQSLAGGQATVLAPELKEITGLATTLNTSTAEQITAPQVTTIAAAAARQAQQIMQQSTVKLNPLQKLAIKKAAKQLSKKGSAMDGTNTVLLVILALLLPPLAVYLYEGAWTKRCTINLILTLLCLIPGVIHALIVVLS